VNGGLNHRHQRSRLSLLAVGLLVLAGCGDPIGTACGITGSGFHASDPCRHQCLQYRTVSCPDGTSLRPQFCSGRSGCEPGSCPAGQFCFTIDDPFNGESFCLPDTTCGDLSGEALAALEQTSLQRALQARAWAEQRRAARGAGPAPTTGAAKSPPGPAVQPSDPR